MIEKHNVATRGYHVFLFSCAFVKGDQFFLDACELQP